MNRHRPVNTEDWTPHKLLCGDVRPGVGRGHWAGADRRTPPRALREATRGIASRSALPLLLCVASLCSSAPGLEQGGQDAGSPDLADMALRDLLELEVVSVSKAPQLRHHAPAAVHVITAEDIRRAGVLSIPEALRLAPGVQVARINANKWAITVRGFNTLYAQKLLVLVDGKTVYSPLFSGVHWEELDFPVEDIERIEVIRGPSAALWGANAVNGVINIITKPAQETQGGLFSTATGTDLKTRNVARYGGQAGESLSYRVYAKYADRNDFRTQEGQPAEDDWRSVRTGFRLDWVPETEDRLVVQGHLYDQDSGMRIMVPRNFPPGMRTLAVRRETTAGFVQGVWRRQFANEGALELKLSYERGNREHPALVERRDTVNTELLFRQQPGGTHRFTAGLGYRYTADDTFSDYGLDYDPASRADHLVWLYANDEITLVPDRLKLTLGAEAEHNAYSGFEFQPSARLAYTPSDKQMFWAAVSRAVQVPSRSFHDARFSVARFPFGEIAIQGNEDSGAEEVFSADLGYRRQLRENLSLDLAVFFNHYDQLRTTEQQFPRLGGFPPHLILAQRYANKMEGNTYGAELVVDWQPLPRWQLSATYSWLNMDLRLDSSSNSRASLSGEEESPQHQARLHSRVDLGKHWEWDTTLYYVDRLAALDTDSYLRLDTRLGWRPTEAVDVSVGAQNLLGGPHKEFEPIEGVVPNEIRPSVYGMITWRF